MFNFRWSQFEINTYITSFLIKRVLRKYYIGKMQDLHLFSGTSMFLQAPLSSHIIVDFNNRFRFYFIFFCCSCLFLLNKHKMVFKCGYLSSKNVEFICLNESPLKMIKICFFFLSKKLFSFLRYFKLNSLRYS